MELGKTDPKKDKPDPKKDAAHRQIDFIIDSGCRSLSETTLKMIAATERLVRIKLRRQSRKRMKQRPKRKSHEK